MLPTLLNTPKTDQELSIWSFAHRDDHDLVAEALRTRFGVQLTHNVLDPIPQFDMQDWLLRHQNEHNDNNGLLGSIGVDLTEVNFDNPSEKSSWFYIHYLEHYNWHQALGI
jgi:hypothetical protein